MDLELDVGLSPLSGSGNVKAPSESSPSPLEMKNPSRSVTATGLAKLSEYPTHGVIGASESPWMNIFHSSRNSEDKKGRDFRMRKFDFHEMYEKDLKNIITPSPMPGLWNTWYNFNEGRTTSQMYEVDPKLPKRFENPELFQGYGYERREHPFFRTTASSYGEFPPTIHDVPREYHALKRAFTSHLARTGMPKNRSLNIK